MAAGNGAPCGRDGRPSPSSDRTCRGIPSHNACRSVRERLDQLVGAVGHRRRNVERPGRAPLVALAGHLLEILGE